MFELAEHLGVSSSHFSSNSCFVAKHVERLLDDLRHKNKIVLFIAVQTIYCQLWQRTNVAHE